MLATVLNLLAVPALAAVVVLNVVDGPGEGLNDATPVYPEGGNTGETLGELRMNVLRAAADAWAAAVKSKVVITIDVAFDPLPCDAQSAVLGWGEPLRVYADFAGAPQTDTWYVGALADALSGVEQDPGAADLALTFNSDIDNNSNCLTNTDFFYGVNGSDRFGDVNLFSTALHEISHGLGFLSLVESETGQRFLGTDDIFSSHLHNGNLEPWPTLTASQRAASFTGEAYWVGEHVANAAEQTLDAANGLLLAGDTVGVEMYTPATVEEGSSISHWAEEVSPNQLMEPTIHEPAVVSLQPLDKAVMADLGWGLLNPEENHVVRGGDYLEPGFPIYIPASGGAALNRRYPVIGNIDADQELELVYYPLSYLPMAYNHDGSTVSGWPVAGGVYGGTPVLGNFDNDTESEVGITYSGNAVVNQGCRAEQFDGDGGVLFDSAYLCNLRATIPVSVDLDNDGIDELVFGDEQNLHVASADGSAFANWPAPEQLQKWEANSPISIRDFNAMAVADLEGDGRNEVLVIAEALNFYRQGEWSFRLLFVFNFDGSIRPGFPVELEITGRSSLPVIADLDGDQVLDIAVVDSARESETSGLYLRIFSASGKRLNRIRLPSTGDAHSQSLIAADLDNDGNGELLTMSGEQIYAYHSDGSVVAGWPVAGSDNFAVGDLDGDGNADVATVVDHPLTTYEYSERQQVFVYSADGVRQDHLTLDIDRMGQSTTDIPLSIADMDRDGRNELLVLGEYWGGTSGVFPYVWMFDFGGRDHGRIDWGQYASNANNSGVLLGHEASWAADDSDIDGDGLPDIYEISNGLHHRLADGLSDFDNDGLTNQEEYSYGTKPYLRDSDADGMADPYEIANNLDPLVASAELDSDSDGFSDLSEYLAGSDPQDYQSKPISLTGEVVQASSTTVSYHYTPNITFLNSGESVVVWRAGDIFAQRFGLSGHPVGEAIQVSTDDRYSHNSPTVLANGDGGFSVYWNSLGSEGGFSRHFNDEGQLLSEPVELTDSTLGDKRNLVVAQLSDGSRILVWQAGSNVSYDVYAQRLASDGELLGAQFQVNTTSDGNQTNPDVAVLADGSFVVVWQSGDNLDRRTPGVYAQRFDVDAKPLGNEFRINSAGKDGQSFPSTVGLSGGGFVIAWQSLYQDGSQLGIFARLYTGAGEPLGDEFQVNTYAQNSQALPRLTALDNGGFVVAWLSIGQDDGTTAVYGQRYQGDGNALGPEFKIFNANDVRLTSKGNTFAAAGVNYNEAFARFYFVDADADGMGDVWEVAHGYDPSDASDATSDADTDLLNAREEFSSGGSPDVSDTDGDTLSDYEERQAGTKPYAVDSDGDGISDKGDLFPLESTESMDSDLDGLGDNGDNCPSLANADQRNTDQDGHGDACDSDDDGDGVGDVEDAFPLDPLRKRDTDGDGIANLDDSDDDGDEVADEYDAYPLDRHRSVALEIQLPSLPKLLVVGELFEVEAVLTPDNGTQPQLIWDFGDGTNTVVGTRVAHAYRRLGEHLITLTATLDNGESLTRQWPVKVVSGLRSLSGGISGLAAGDSLTLTLMSASHEFHQSLLLHGDGNTLNYEFRDMPVASDYQLFWQGEGYDSGFWSGKEQGAVSWEKAQLIDLTYQDISGLDIAIDQGKSLSLLLTGLNDGDEVEVSAWSPTAGALVVEAASVQNSDPLTMQLNGLRAANDYVLYVEVNDHAGLSASGYYQGQNQRLGQRLKAENLTPAGQTLNILVEEGEWITGNLEGLPPGVEARIEAWSQSTGNLVQLTRQYNGWFYFRLPPARDYRIKVSAPGLYGGYYTGSALMGTYREAALLDLSETGVSQVYLELYDGRRLSGQVTDIAYGQQGVVDLWSLDIGHWQSVSLADDGSYQLTGIRPGIYRVSLTVPGALASKPQTVDVTDQDVSDIHFSVTPGASVYGRITGLDDASVADMEALWPEVVTSVGNRLSVTDNSATYLLSGLPAAQDLQLQLSADSVRYYYAGGASLVRAPQSLQSLRLNENENRELNLDLTESEVFSISGVVTGLDTEADGDLLITISAWSTTSGVAQQAVIAGNGAFTLSDLPAGDYYLRIQAQGYVEQYSRGLGQWTASWNQALPVAVTADVSAMSISLSKGYSLWGQLRDSTGVSKSGIYINVWDDEQQIGKGTTTRLDGSYRVEGLAPGSYRVSAGDRAARVEQSLDLSEDSQLDLTLVKATGTITGNLEIADAAGATIYLYYADNGTKGDFVSWQTAAKDGSYRLEGLSEGVSYRLEVDTDGNPEVMEWSALVSANP